MADPVSWLLIERGWRVVGSDGEEIGRVDEIVGDKNADIFSGLSVSEGIFKDRRFVPSERVRTITPGYVELDLGSEQAAALERYEGAPTSAEILTPDPKR